MDYDRTYSDSPAYFGDSPDPVLVRFDHLLDRSKPVLDIGCGQGRHAVYLARLGFTVHAFDSSQVAIDQLQGFVAAEKLPIYAACARFEELRPKRSDYGGILVFGLIQELPWKEIGLLLRLCREHLASDGLLWLTCFTTLDPSYAEYSESWESIGHNSFQDPEGVIRTFLEPEQILSLVEAFEVVNHWEGLGPEHTHGDGSPERHGRAEAVFRKR
jgi:cyclopropane fatty-acyl-phospholipid synthase-like methyltransferase